MQRRAFNLASPRGIMLTLAFASLRIPAASASGARQLLDSLRMLTMSTATTARRGADSPAAARHVPEVTAHDVAACLAKLVFLGFEGRKAWSCRTAQSIRTFPLAALRACR